MKIRLLDTFATSLVVLAIAGCGGSPSKDTASARTPAPTAAATATATPTAAPTVTATPTPTATATATVTPTATSGAGTGGAQAGDEEGIRVPVDVTVSADRIRAGIDHVAAFLPLRFTVHNTLDRELQVVIVQSGGDGSAVGRVSVPAGNAAAVDVQGLPPGSLEVLSPDLNPDMTAIVRVERGG
jgi:hypothetical protein